ncbi:hypothetical protein GCM10010319_10480 [Streptomyces blastmyceticus]|uniref:Uncharacterized protein n=1 Tax=Streptomyces blastmyceticus TaxID=68180 RepID=A0ABP3G6L2_9ACTN
MGISLSAVALGVAVAEVGQRAVVEAGVIQFHGQCAFEGDPAADRLGGLPVRQIKQELQHTDGGQLSGREVRATATLRPVGRHSRHGQPGLFWPFLELSEAVEVLWPALSRRLEVYAGPVWPIRWAGSRWLPWGMSQFTNA